MGGAGFFFLPSFSAGLVSFALAMKQRAGRDKRARSAMIGSRGKLNRNVLGSRDFPLCTFWHTMTDRYREQIRDVPGETLSISCGHERK